MIFTKSEGPYYDFFAEKDGKTYTIRTDTHEIVGIIVEQKECFLREFYQRGPAKAGLTINKRIFEEALLAICQNSLERWTDLYHELYQDEDYVYPMMEEVFKKHFSMKII